MAADQLLGGIPMGVWVVAPKDGLTTGFRDLMWRRSTRLQLRGVVRSPCESIPKERSRCDALAAAVRPPYSSAACDRHLVVEHDRARVCRPRVRGPLGRPWRDGRPARPPCAGRRRTHVAETRGGRTSVNGARRARPRTCGAPSPDHRVLRLGPGEVLHDPPWPAVSYTSLFQPRF